ncbi:MAG: M28 family metallopeptidase [Xanthomonadaceae bacterium]|nr:M28 family metallopeptidase [Xanthomonadaceae bacterium]
MPSKKTYATPLLVTFALVSACAPIPPAGEAPAFTPATAPLERVVEDAASLIQPDNDARRAAVIALVERAGFETRLFEFPNDGRDESDGRPAGHNVLFSIGPQGYGGAVVAGAHFDAAYLRDGTFLDGMVDNAASVVALIRVATALRDAPLNRRIDFVLFDMEEIGLVGSRHYAQSLPAGAVSAMVNLDVNAYGDTVFFGQTDHGHATLYRSVASACATLAATCIDFRRYPSSDHLSFQAAGIPNVSLSVLPRTEVHQLWLLVNAGPDSGLAEGLVPSVFRTIHSPGDKLDRVEPAAITLAYNLTASVLLELAR